MPKSSRRPGSRGGELLFMAVAVGMVTKGCYSWQTGLRPFPTPMLPTPPRACATGRTAARGSGALTALLSQGSGASRAVAGKAASASQGAGSSAAAWSLKKLKEFGPFAAQAAGFLMKFWAGLPVAVRALINPRDLLLFVISRLLYSKTCRALHACHTFLWRRLGILWEPYPYEESVLGFVEPKLGYLTQILGILYLVNVAVAVLVDIGWRVPGDSSKLIANLVYIFYFGFVVASVKKAYLPVWFPSLQDDKRRSYIIDRSTSVVIYILAILCAMECACSFFKVPLSSSLAFGGIGGLAFGLAAKDVISNFFGGVMLLFTEPFTPGDMVCFSTRGHAYEGKVERVGWYQTRLRGKDTRPTYVPNSVFVDTMVTNMDRITHRRFETTFYLRFQDLETLPLIQLEIKKALKVLPKVDMLQPFRVHFVQYGAYCLVMQVSAFFATKSLDEYLYLQQLALMEIGRVVTECGCKLAYPTNSIDLEPRAMGEVIVSGVVDYQADLQTRAADVSVGPRGPPEEEDELGVAGPPPRGPPPPPGGGAAAGGGGPYQKVRIVPGDEPAPPPPVPRPPVTPPPDPAGGGAEAAVPTAPPNPMVMTPLSAVASAALTEGAIPATAMVA